MKLVDARVESLLSIRGLAKKSGVDWKTIHNIEKGYALPSLATIKKLAEVLQVNPRDIDEFKASMEKAAGRKEDAPANV